MAQSSSPPSFDCYNMNYYRKFPTKPGLRARLWHNNSCKKYMSSERPYASCREGVADESQRRPGYGVQSTRLNPTMSADAPLFSPCDEFDYDAFLGDLTCIPGTTCTVYRCLIYTVLCTAVVLTGMRSSIRTGLGNQSSTDARLSTQS